MKKLILLLPVFVLLVWGFTTPKTSPLQLRLYNKTGYDLDSVSIEKTYIGFIAKDSVVTVNGCKTFTVSKENLPLSTIDGSIRGLKNNSAIRGMRIIMPGSHVFTEGFYNYDILLSENHVDSEKYGYSLRLAVHSFSKR